LPAAGLQGAKFKGTGRLTIRRLFGGLARDGPVTVLVVLQLAVIFFFFGNGGNPRLGETWISLETESQE
jgi:hypothetical protein